jgi:hypothetical protein
MDSTAHESRLSNLYSTLRDYSGDYIGFAKKLIKPTVSFVNWLCACDLFLWANGQGSMGLGGVSDLCPP